MSSLLDQAIIDAKVLMETARKNAEAAIIKKYEPDINKQIQALLEQDDPMADAGGEGDIPATEPDLSMPPMGGDAMAGGQASPETQKFVDRVPAAYLGEDNMQEIEINLDSIVEKIDQMQKDMNVYTSDMSEPAHEVIPHANISNMPPEALAEGEEQQNTIDEECMEEGTCNEKDDTALEEETVEEEYQLDEELVMDLSNVSAGGIHANEGELRRQHDIAKALEAQNAELMEQLTMREQQFNALEEKVEAIYSNLKETKGKLKKSTDVNVKLKEGFEFLSRKINDVNLLNARLLYTNKVLGNSSLNERQKQQIAESISRSKTVDEAKTIYNTLQKSAGAVSERKTAPQSLTEAVSRSSSPFLPRNNGAPAHDPMTDRWQRIAGIKK